MDVRTLTEAVVERVKHQMEVDEWDGLMTSQFRNLCSAFFDQIQTLTQAVETSLVQFPSTTVRKVWETRREPERMTVRFDQRELIFTPVGNDANQPGDRWTIRITKNGDNLVGRYFVQQERLGTLHFATLVSGAMAEKVTESHLLVLFGRELMQEGR